MDSKDVLTLAKVLAKALLVAFAYGLPALVAVYRRHDRSEAIARLNLLLGWTVIGWLVLLARALRWTPRRSHLWRRLAGGPGGSRRPPPGSGGNPARPRLAFAEGWRWFSALPAAFRRKLGPG